ncbi:MAG: RNA polymerase-binding protein RbpA [Actinomycetota bacterium]|nr:MAG: RNA polymerase-binding protein RbpA [Actinomycetota bacterium]
MGEGALRGTRLGATSYENDDHVELASRQLVTYDCPHGHSISLPFSLEAEIPPVWECRCGAQAVLRNGEQPAAKPARAVRTHWDMLLERRSVEDLEVLLAERLDVLHAQRGHTHGRKSA